MDAYGMLQRQLDEAYRVIRSRAEGLTDDEFWWEPGPGCWTVRMSPDGRWAADYDIPDPDPPPFTTMGWRLVHVAESKIMYHEYAFGAGRLTWPEIDSAHTPAAAIAQLEEGQALLVDDLQSLGAEDLERSVQTNWGETWPAWRVFETMIHHDLHHGAEIGALRDVYRVTRTAGSVTAT